MKIVKRGLKPSTSQPLFFTCYVCGCEFIAQKDEYKWKYTDRPEFSGEPIAHHFEAICPCCFEYTETTAEERSYEAKP